MTYIHVLNIDNPYLEQKEGQIYPTVIYLNKANSSDTESKKEGKVQESVQSSTTPDPGYQWESDNVTIRHQKREPRGQPFSNR